MFKLLTQKEQLQIASREIARLKSIIGEGETVNKEETMQIEQPKLTERMQALETMELERILGGGF